MDYSLIKIAESFYSIEQDFVRCFLFEGEQEALLIDTGIGGDLRSYVETITKLPIRVILTHADRDHVGAIEQFDTSLMHPCEFDYFMRKNQNTMSPNPVWEGDIIDIGPFRFEVLLIPGHTPGSIALLEREKRFLIGGDSIQTGTIFMFGEGRNFTAYRASMLKLQKLLGEIDTVYASHGDMAVKPDTILKLYEGTCKVMRKEIQGSPVLLHGNNVNCYKFDGVSFFAD